MNNIINNLKDSFSCINENKYIIGLTMICLNIGARFIIDELDDDLRSQITHKYIRKFIIFCSFFMATKDFFTSVVLTIIFVIFINEFLGDDDDEDNNIKDTKGGSFNKKEIEKAIQTLKTVQINM
jgi:hypothetical protein